MMTQVLGVHYFDGPNFRIWQVITYMFMHDYSSLFHIMFNMFALYTFGSSLEYIMGSKRFLNFYLITGLGALALQLLVQGFDMGCQSCMRRMKRGRQYNFFRLIHVPVFARGCERVVWVWERAMQKKWCICSLCLLQPGHGPFCDPMGRVQVLGQSGAPGLLAAAELKRWCGKGMLVANEFIHMGVLLASPTPPMAEFIIGMVNAQVHMVKAVKRGFDVAGWVVFPSFPNFLPMATRRLAARLVGQAWWSRLGVLRRFDFNVLQVGFTHVKSLVSRIAQGLRQGSLVQGKLNAVVANTMARRHPPRHQGGPVGHADGGCHVAFIGHPPTAGQCVQVRGLDSGVAIAAQMVSPVLVSDENDEIGGFGHGGLCSISANASGFDHVGPFGQIGIHTPV